MSLKQYLQEDINNVFFNTGEFAETHTINGTPVDVIVDNDQLMHRSKKEYDGISVGEILFFGSKVELDPVLEGLPNEGTPLIFDGKQTVVFNSREDAGVYEIILRQNKGML